VMYISGAYQYSHVREPIRNGVRMRLSLAGIAWGGVAIAIIGFAMAVVRSSHSVPWLVLGVCGVVSAVCLWMLARHWANGTVLDEKTALLLAFPAGMLIMTGVAFAYL
jgi:hypothetical protein